MEAGPGATNEATKDTGNNTRSRDPRGSIDFAARDLTHANTKRVNKQHAPAPVADKTASV